MLRALGASPGAIIREGGCCSGKSRLAIVAYRDLGLPAAQVTLYHHTGCAQHCAVEVVFRDGAMIVDPMYGIFYVDAAGQPLGLDGLRRGIPPVFRPIPGSSRTSYPSDPYYDFAYRDTRTANWTATALRRYAHRFLSAVTAARIDTVRQPAALEWPQLVLSAVLGVTFGIAHVLAVTPDDMSPAAVAVAVLRLTLPVIIISGVCAAATVAWGKSWSGRVAQHDSGP